MKKYYVILSMLFSFQYQLFSQINNEEFDLIIMIDDKILTIPTEIDFVFSNNKDQDDTLKCSYHAGSLVFKNSESDEPRQLNSSSSHFGLN